MKTTSWKLRIDLGEPLVLNQKTSFLFSQNLRIPSSGSVLLTDEVKKIIDSKPFQRLRGVKQLGPTLYVYPGATHTRFEHSIGVYHLALQFLERLTKLKDFRENTTPLDKTIKLTVLSALLHDIGHYPFSHWIEEIKLPGNVPIKNHEERAKDIIETGELNDLIREEWNVDPIAVSRIIKGKPKTGAEKIIHTMLDSILDIDKLDYLIRDSLHCGVNYGLGIDLRRMLDALFFDVEKNRVALTTKAKSYPAATICCRNAMYQEVYWHKTVRACTCMLKFLLFSMVRRSPAFIKSLPALFQLSDDGFISKIFHVIQTSKSSQKPIFAGLEAFVEPFLFENRRLFKLTHSLSPADENPAAFAEPRERFMKKVFEKAEGKDYEGIIALSDKIVKRLKKKIPALTPGNVLLETTPTKLAIKQWDLKSLRYWDARKGIFERETESVSVLNRNLKELQKIFIFCHPDFYQPLKDISFKAWTDIFDSLS